MSLLSGSRSDAYSQVSHGVPQGSVLLSFQCFETSVSYSWLQSKISLSSIHFLVVSLTLSLNLICLSVRLVTRQPSWTDRQTEKSSTRTKSQLLYFLTIVSQTKTHCRVHFYNGCEIFIFFAGNIRYKSSSALGSNRLTFLCGKIVMGDTTGSTKAQNHAKSDFQPVNWVSTGSIGRPLEAQTGFEWFSSNCKISGGLKKWALAFCREGESWIRLNKWRIYLILDVCPIWRKNEIKGFVRGMDWERKCDSEYVRIRKQMHHCGRRNQASVLAAYIMAWCKTEDTVSLILITSTCARSEPVPSASSEGWHRIALTCNDVQLKSFRWEPQHLLICSASAPPLGNEAEILKTGIKTKLFSRSFILLCCLTGRKKPQRSLKVSCHDSQLFEFKCSSVGDLHVSPYFFVSVWNNNSCCRAFISEW